MDLDGFLGHLLRPAAPSTLAGRDGRAGIGGMPESDCGKGALAGGALGLLLGPAQVARAASAPEPAAEMRLASLVACGADDDMERACPDALARQPGIDESLKQRLEQGFRAAAGWAAAVVDAPAAAQ
jgi:hypothetical protein